MICDIKTDSQYIAIKADSEDIHLGTSGIKNDLIISDSNLIKFKWWVRKNSNLRPPLYQSGILTN